MQENQPSQPEPGDLDPEKAPDETDGNYPDNVELTGGSRTDEPDLDEPTRD